MTLSWRNLDVRNRREFGALNHSLFDVFWAEHRRVRLLWYGYLLVLEDLLGKVALIILL